VKVFNYKSQKNIWLFNVIAIITIISTIHYFPLQKIYSYEKKDNNASSCPYYFTLESLLASYPLLSFDKANATFIKNKLQKFERKMKNPTLSTEIFNQYKIPYENKLRASGLTSIDGAQSDADVINAATQVTTIVDGYYLNKKINCQNTYYDWGLQSHRLLRYNLNGLYDMKPDKYSIILMSTNQDWITGSTAGHFMVNQTETLDTRFMAGLPLLTALYVTPRNDFSKSGNYSSPANFRYFNATNLQDLATRKAMDIGGVDIFTFFKSDLKNNKVADTRILPSAINPRFSELFESRINTRSYGHAYFANSITYADPAEIRGYEQSIQRYFRHRDDPAAFTATTNILYDRLLKLQSKHDIILESKPLPKMFSEGDIQIKGIVGERSFFETNCRGKQCLFVFNTGDAPGWHAYVNGKESKILRANFAFMATVVPSGASTIWFIYSSITQLSSYFLSIITLLIIIFGTLRQMQRRSNNSEAGYVI
jgi:hypothetical protein